MSRKTLGILYTASVLLFCASLVWHEYKRENNRTYRVTITPNHSAETSTSLVSLSATETVISDEKDSTYSMTTASAFTTITTAVKAVTESIEELYEEIYIDINNADIDELIRLDGIGDILAARIIDYREENGGFSNIEEIMNVYGIGEGIFRSIADFIYVENPVYESPPDEKEYSEYPESVLSEEIPIQEPTEYQLTLEDIAPIELNQADIEQLMLLPYVDEEIAQKIIELRTAMHGFSHPYEIAYIEELSDMQAAEIVKYVYVEGAGI